MSKKSFATGMLLAALLSCGAQAQPNGRVAVISPTGAAYRADHNLQNIFQRILPFTQRRDISYRLQVLRDENTINAYAETDGRIILTTGLLHALPRNDSNALAFVMAHELSHLERRHHQRLATQNTLTNVGIGLLVRDQSDLLRTAAGVGSRMLTSGYSRGMEAEADASGLELMRMAGFNPRGAITTLDLFRRLEASRGRTRVFPDHPTAEDRLKDARNYLQQHGM
ncbi:MAG: M48 family metallopeptidase [Candidatus Eremiobacteraeota bacterium]|nr:M48 family metallopeptidase [Candidatus Eremiobacteraeota bacterium]MCW5872476.1 M48 family metallopeptidase [Candidatus Eremiobacteraeota bacterium]